MTTVYFLYSPIFNYTFSGNKDHHQLNSSLTQTNTVNLHVILMKMRMRVCVCMCASGWWRESIWLLVPFCFLFLNEVKPWTKTKKRGANSNPAVIPPFLWLTSCSVSLCLRTDDQIYVRLYEGVCVYSVSLCVGALCDCGRKERLVHAKREKEEIPITIYRGITPAQQSPRRSIILTP